MDRGRLRIFWAATLPESTIDEIVSFQQRMGPHFSDARFEGEDKLHITLHFIGDFESARVESLEMSVKSELDIHPHKSPETTIVGASFFPDERTRRGIWLDCEDDGTLAAFAKVLKEVSTKYGVLPESRAYKAHITIARFHAGPDRRHPGNSRFGPHAGERHGSPDLKKFVLESKLPAERFLPKSIALFESTLKPSGSEYRILYEYLLE